MDGVTLRAKHKAKMRPACVSGVLCIVLYLVGLLVPFCEVLPAVGERLTANWNFFGGLFVPPPMKVFFYELLAYAL